MSVSHGGPHGYLAEGTGLAERFVATPDGGVEHVSVLDADSYETWVASRDPLTGEARGRLRTDANAVRFVEFPVNGPKTWSLAAALHPDAAEAYDAALDRAASRHLRGECTASASPVHGAPLILSISVLHGNDRTDRLEGVA